MTKKQRNISITLSVLVVCALGVTFVFERQKAPVPTEISSQQEASPEPEPILPVEPRANAYTALTLSSENPIKELGDAVGKDNVDTVLRINRIDSRFLAKGMILTVPSDMSDLMALSPLPRVLPTAQSIPKILIISQRVQAFGAYEYGVLTKWGPVSSGKKSTPTPSKLFFANWKGKEVVSTVDDEWILKWNFNLDNFDGIGMHLYEMPGHPASHSCVRLLEDDALWLYDWVEQWILERDGVTLKAHGTPVLIFGKYDFESPAPWKQLVTDSQATSVLTDEIDEVLMPQLELIAQRQTERDRAQGESTFPSAPAQ